MNIFSALLDTMASFVRNNPLTVVVIVMLAVFVPSLFGALLIGALILVLLLVAWPVIMLFRLRRMGRRIEVEAKGTTRTDNTRAASAANAARAT